MNYDSYRNTVLSILYRTISEINDISLLEEVRNAIRNLISIRQKTSTSKRELTPLVKKMCFGHGLDSRLSDKAILEDELRKK